MKVVKHRLMDGPESPMTCCGRRIADLLRYARWEEDVNCENCHRTASTLPSFKQWLELMVNADASEWEG